MRRTPRPVALARLDVLVRAAARDPSANADGGGAWARSLLLGVGEALGFAGDLDSARWRPDRRFPDGDGCSAYGFSRASSKAELSSGWDGSGAVSGEGAARVGLYAESEPEIVRIREA